MPNPNLLQGLDASLVGVVPYSALRLGIYDALRWSYKQVGSYFCMWWQLWSAGVAVGWQRHFWRALQGGVSHPVRGCQRGGVAGLCCLRCCGPAAMPPPVVQWLHGQPRNFVAHGFAAQPPHVAAMCRPTTSTTLTPRQPWCLERWQVRGLARCSEECGGGSSRRPGGVWQLHGRRRAPLLPTGTA